MNVVFVCTGNICRSPMAEAVARHLERRVGGRDQYSSAGTHAIVGAGATQQAQDAMAELEIPLRWHRARQLTPAVVQEADLLVALNTEHVAYIEQHFSDARVTLLDTVPDPYGHDLDTYRSARDQIAVAVENRIGEWGSRAQG